MFDWAAIARPLGRCRVVGRSKQSRQARGASGRSSIHTFNARASSRRAVFSRFSRPQLHAHVPSTNQENVRMVPCLAARRQQCAARRNSPHFFPGRWQSPYSSLILVACFSFTNTSSSVETPKRLKYSLWSVKKKFVRYTKHMYTCMSTNDALMRAQILILGRFSQAQAARQRDHPAEKLEGLAAEERRHVQRVSLILPR